MRFRVPKSQILEYLYKRIGMNVIQVCQSELALPEESRREFIPVSKENAHLHFISRFLDADENECVSLNLEEAKFLDYLYCDTDGFGHPASDDAAEVLPAEMTAAG